VSGGDGKPRRARTPRGQASVLAVRGDERPRTWPRCGPSGQVAVAERAAAAPAEAWRRRGCGEGAQRPRVYDRAYLPRRPATRAGWARVALPRRHPERAAERARYRGSAPATPRAASVRAAGARWALAEPCELAAGRLGLGHDAVRRWRGWHRHITRALVALAALTLGATGTGRPPAPAPSRSRPARPAACWSASPGPAGAVSTRRSARPAIVAAA